MTRYLIVNADDFGISAGVSRGILEGHQRGILTSTSAMVNLPDTAAFIRRAQQEAPRLGIGLHFTLSFGKPVSAAERVPSLVTAEGRFCSTYETLQEMAKGFTADDLRTELTAQFDRFVEIAGQLPDHLNSHHAFTYTHPDAYDVLRGLAEQHRLPIRNEGWFLNLGQGSTVAER
ncbi:MAG: ChbG/HpnK family deacetylase, partial [Anaerolineae bacterium]|nr:ChbG/HpnK family deacetylase [Anaerolineae bacterium]